MPYFDELPSGERDAQEQRLIGDLHRMYHSEIEDAQPLARVRRRLAESRASVVRDPASTPQRHSVLSAHREAIGTVNSSHSRVSMGRTWQQRLGIIAAVLFVTVLVSSLIIVLARTLRDTCNSGAR